MTFKHTKFEDSPVMRSLEKVAQEKGMIKNDPVVKTAAKKTPIDLVPSDSLLDNVVKLCAALRERGFVKQAEDVENNLIAYKQAQTLYDVSKEKGEDVVEFAHPEGSHQLVGVDATGDGAVIEDILDQMAKSIQVVEKKPTGKLTESQKAIEAVKVILGVSFLDLKTLYAQAQDALEKFRSVAGSLAMKMGESANYDADFLNEVKDVLDQGRVHAMGDSFGRKFPQVLNGVIDDMKSGLEPSYLNPFGWGGPSAWSPEQQQNWQEVQKYWPVLKKYADRFQSVVAQIDNIEGGAERAEEGKEVQQFDPEGGADALTTKLQGLMSAIDTDIGRVQQKRLTNATDLIAWLNRAKDNFVARALQQLSSSDKGEAAIATAQKQYDNIKSKVDAFEQRWLA